MRGILSVLLMFAVLPAFADDGGLLSAMESVRKDCGGISDELSDIKTMAGVNTAVTGVGTGVGIGAVAVGVVKAKTDKELQETQKVIAELEAQGAKPIKNQDEFAEIFGGFLIETGDAEFVQIGEAIQRKNQLEKKSKSLGNWRTGLMATNTATNIAGAVIAGTNRVQDDLQSKINKCMASVNKLRSVYMQVRMETGADAQSVARAEKIIAECGAWETADTTPINKRATGAMISSGVGAGVGLAGTVTSAMANTDKVRSGDDKKEQNLNTAANVMAGAATVASATATVFNATQISAVKKIVEIADKCEGVL